MKHIHPHQNDQGDTVTIHHPSVPSSLEAFADPNQVAIVVPNGQRPAQVNGIALEVWNSAPTRLADWLQVAGQADIDEPPLLSKLGKKLAAGAIVLEPDGRFWAVAPTNAFGGYKATFPKGTIEIGMNPQVTAIKEVFEESGLQIKITCWIGDFERTTSLTRYYMAQRISGDPTQMGWESQAVLLVPKEKIFTVLSHEKDYELLTAMFAKLEALPQSCG